MVLMLGKSPLSFSGYNESSLPVEKHMGIVKMINMAKFYSSQSINCAGLQLQILPLSEMIIKVAMNFHLEFLVLKVRNKE